MAGVSDPAGRPGSCCIHSLFEAQARARPSAVAVESAGEALTYGELDRRADAMASRLAKAGVGPGIRVGICADRGPALFAGMLGALKAGGAYLCLDPDYPRERLRQIWEDSKAPVLLASRTCSARLPVSGKELILLDDERLAGDAAPDEGRRAGRPPAAAGPDDAAYVIFTSGSTGRPKGVLLRHRGLCNLIEASIRLLDLGPGDRILQFSALTFDASVWEIFMALGSGAALVLPGPADRFLAAALRKILLERRVTVALLPPSLMALLPPDGLPELRAVISVGERLPAETARRWSAGRRLINGYGPAEATITASVFEVRPDEDYPPGGPPIGRPVQNVSLYVLDPNLEPVPAGEPGELFVGGVGVAMGYLDQPDLNREKFLPDPFSEEPSARMYRTGDLGRRLPDGNLEFLGRRDSQVKVRGYRVELGEVEAALRSHPGVAEAVALVCEDRAGRPRLAAFFLPAQAPAPDSDSLRGHMTRKLPGYMVPESYVALETLPRTPNGKLDLKALAARKPF